MKFRDIMLKDIIRIDNPDNYRLHFAVSDNGHEPLDDYTASFKRWTCWQKYYRGYDRFPVNYIISFMNFYPKPGSALFGGIFEVTCRHWELAETDPANFYDVQLVEDYSAYIGRLIVETYKADSENHSMRREFNLDRYDSIKVLEILPARYRRRSKFSAIRRQHRTQAESRNFRTHK